MMSEKEREMEEKEEEVILDHFSHDHPLPLIETHRGDQCYGCGKYFTSGEAAYGCKECEDDEILLHEECAEMPRDIRHPMHPQHILTQRRIESDMYEDICAVCERPCVRPAYVFKVMHYNYHCASCSDFAVHLECAVASMGLMNSIDAYKEKQSIRHDSHPAHELRLLGRNRGSCSFKCDACGTIQKGNSKICSICQYWIHESCASLPETMDTENQHHHHRPLSLAIQLPIEYIKFEYKCDICDEALLARYWVYHCEICRFVAHIKCALKPATTSINDANAAGVIQLPIKDVSEELIKPFVLRHGGEMVIPCDENGKCKFHNHHHQLNLISLEEKVDDDDDHEYHLDDERRSELICDGYIMPIYQKKTQLESSSSLSSSDKYKYYYMSCGECNYVLHLACFNLPPQLPSLPLLHTQNHKLILQTSSIFNKTWCVICYLYTDGLYYACTEKGCDFKADIKCACLPDTIKVVAHPKHYFKLVNKEDSNSLRCIACGEYPLDSEIYTCDSCEFSLHLRCALQPAANKHRWDEHPLPLAYDANINHPSEFYCDICEVKMNPKTWMYHCRECDHSFHPYCLTATSGTYRNLKFGQKYVSATFHDPHHPLTYQVITTKLHCDLCHGQKRDCPGFLWPCGDSANGRNAIHAVH